MTRRLSLSHPAPWRDVVARTWHSRSVEEDLSCGHVLYLQTGPDPRPARRRRCGECVKEEWVFAVGAAIRRQLMHPGGRHERPTFEMLQYLYEAYPDVEGAARQYLSDHHLI